MGWLMVAGLEWLSCFFMGVSKNRGTPKSSILIEFSIINHPFWGTTIFGNTQMVSCFLKKKTHLKASHGEENIEILGYFGGD